MAFRSRMVFGLATTAAAVAVASSLNAAGNASPQQVTSTELAELSGTVSAPGTLGQLSVYAFNTDRSVGYLVYVVDGQYRATHLFPGHYQISLRGTTGQLNMDMPAQTATADITAGQKASADFTTPADLRVPATYVGGLPYPNAKIEPFSTIYPAGRGRELMGQTCFGCHTVQVYPYNIDRTYPGGRPAHDHDGWEITVSRMAHGVAFNAKGKPSYFDEKLLSPKDEEVLVDYLAKNFGPDSQPRAVRQETQPILDKVALAKAEIIEYRFLNKPGENRFTHTIDFDPTSGNVFAMDRGAPAVVELDPRTGIRKDHKALFGGEYLQVDVDGTVWYGGLAHLDPKTDQHDIYEFEGGKPIPISSMAIDSSGDMWLSQLGGGAIAKHDRKTDQITWWDVPILRSRPYGITVDHDDRVWFAEYHNSAIASFDPKTQTFRNYPVIARQPSNIRRTSADSKNVMWTTTWGHVGDGQDGIEGGGSIYRIDPKTGKSTGYKLGIDYSNPYDAEMDDQDNVWVATDNHIVMLDQKRGRIVRYPTATRTDIPKLAVTREGAVWFSPRNAGQSGGYGGAAAVLYTDKDNIKTMAAYYSDNSVRNRRMLYKGATTKVTGVTKFSPTPMQNPGAYDRMLAQLGLAPGNKKGGDARVLKGGAAQE